MSVAKEEGRSLWDVPGLLVPEESVAGNGQSLERSLVENLFLFFGFFFSFFSSLQQAE